MEECDNCGCVPWEILAFHMESGLNEVTYRCDCKTVKVGFTRGDEQSRKAREFGYEMWKKKNPDSESEAGVDADKVWEATLDALDRAFCYGYITHEVGMVVLPEKRRVEFESILKGEIGKFIDSDRRGPP